MKILTNYINSLKAKVNKSSLSKRLFEGVSWTLIGNIAGKFFQLLAFIFVARIVGKEEYGQVGIVRSTINMFLIFSSAGMGMTATRHIAMFRTSNPFNAYQIYKFSVKFVLWMGLIISALVFFFSDFIAENQLNDIKLSSALKIGSLVLFLLTVSSIQTGALYGFERFRLVGINTTINGFVLLVSVTLGAYYWGINGVVAGLGVAALFMVFQLFFSLKNDINEIKHSQVQPNGEPLKLKSIFLQFSLPAVLQGLVFIPVLWWAKTFLIDHSDYGEMALYDVAEQWYYVVLFVPSSLSAIILPLLTNTNYNGTVDQYNKLLKFNLMINVGISFAIAVVVALFSPLIYKFYGAGFTDYRPLLILLITVVITAANNVFGQVIAAKGKMWIGFGVNLFWAFLLIMFSVLFIGKYQFGALGLALALLTSYFIHSIAQAWVAVKLKNY